MAPLLQISPSPHGRFAAARSVAQGSEGFTLVEMLLAGTLMAAVIGTAATALVVANTSSGEQGEVSRVDSLIDHDLAAIQALDRQFTCCTGSPCTANASTISASTSCRNSAGAAVNPGNENYYSPRQDDTAGRNTLDTPDMTRFREACAKGTIASSFQSMLPTLPSPEAPAGLSRSVSSPKPNPTNKLTITYEGSISGKKVITRVVHLIPTAANWCP